VAFRVGDAAEVFSRSADRWLPVTVTRVDGGRVTVMLGSQLGERERVVDLAVPAAVLDATLRLGRADVAVAAEVPPTLPPPVAMGRVNRKSCTGTVTSGKYNGHPCPHVYERVGEQYEWEGESADERDRWCENVQGCTFYTAGLPVASAYWEGTPAWDARLGHPTTDVPGLTPATAMPMVAAAAAPALPLPKPAAQATAGQDRPGAGAGAAKEELKEPGVRPALCERKIDRTHHRGFDLAKLDKKYAKLKLTDADFEATRAQSEGDTARWQQFILKLGRGEAANIMVIGGSETAGMECLEPKGTRLQRLGRDCAWPSRLHDWLHHTFPAAVVTVENVARGATTTRVFLASIGTLLGDDRAKSGKPVPDMILSDFCINDAYEEKGPGSSSTGVYHPGESAKVVKCAQEVLIRAIHELAPSAVFVSVVVPNPRCRVMAAPINAVARFYGAPTIDMTALASAKALWRTPRIEQHPHWFVHQYMADVVVYAFRREIQAICGQRCSSEKPCGGGWQPAPPAAWPEGSLSAPASLEAMPACLHSISMYSARYEGPCCHEASLHYRLCGEPLQGQWMTPRGCWPGRPTTSWTRRPRLGWSAARRTGGASPACRAAAPGSSSATRRRSPAGSAR
jgi:hypothetical protein